MLAFVPIKKREFLLVSEAEREGPPAIAMPWQDIRQLQLAKAVICAGIWVLLGTDRCSEEKISQVIMARVFETYIDVASAITIGMLPSLPLDRLREFGNAASMGGKLALASGRNKRTEVYSLSSPQYRVS